MIDSLRSGAAPSAGTRLAGGGRLTETEAVAASDESARARGRNLPDRDGNTPREGEPGEAKSRETAPENGAREEPQDRPAARLPAGRQVAGNADMSGAIGSLLAEMAGEPAAERDHPESGPSGRDAAAAGPPHGGGPLSQAVAAAYETGLAVTGVRRIWRPGEVYSQRF